MNTLAISQLSTLRWSLEEDAQGYASRGFSGIGIWRPKLEDFGMERTIELLAETSLSVTSLSWAGGFTGSDGRGYEEAVQDAICAIRDAANLRAETLVVLAGGRNNHIRNHARRTLLDAMRELVVVAEEFGVRLALEPIHPGCGDEWSFVGDLRSTLDIVETIASTHLGLVLDTYHLGMDDEVLRWLPEVMEHVALVQLGDARHTPLGEMNRCLLGSGCVPIPSILAMLGENRYQGPIEVEVLGEDVEHLTYETVLDHTRAFLDRMAESVRQES